MADIGHSITENGKKRSHSNDSDTDRDLYDQQNLSPKTDVTCAHLSKRLCPSGDLENTHLENGETEVTEAGDPGVIVGGSSSPEPNTMIPSVVEDAQSNDSADVQDFDNASTPSITEDEGGLGDLLDLLSSSDAEDEPKEGWRPTFGPISWVQRQMMAGENPKDVLLKLVPDDTEIPGDFDELTLWKIIIDLVTESPTRKKLEHVNTLEDALHLLRTCSKIMVLTGAGVSVSCGIPDFRSRDGIYARLSVEYPDLPDPQAMFDIHYFCHNPRPFFKFAKEIYPGQFQPSLSHKFIKLLEDHGKLLRNYTQNIDTLEQVAGIHKVIQCHGSFATASCMVCKNKVDSEVIRDDIMNQVLPHCEQCPREDEEAIMKPDIVFFGESLPTEFHCHMDKDKGECDLLIVIGSSLKVRPVALIPQSLPPGIPQILINREPLRHMDFDVELLGDCDVIINELCHRLGSDWTGICTRPWTLRQVTSPMAEEAADAQEERGRETSVEETEAAKIETNTERKVQGRENSGEETEVAKTETETECKAENDTEAQPTESGSTAKEDLALTEANSTVTEHQNPAAAAAAAASTSSCPSSKTQESSADEEQSASLENGPSHETFLFKPPCRYIFEGAENYEKRSTDNAWSSSSSSGSSSSSSISGISMDTGSPSPGTSTKDPQPSGSSSSSNQDSHDNVEPSTSSEQQMNDETEMLLEDTDSHDSERDAPTTSTLPEFSENCTSEDLGQKSSTTDVLGGDCCSSSSSGDKHAQINMKEQSGELERCGSSESPEKESSLDDEGVIIR